MLVDVTQEWRCTQVPAHVPSLWKGTPAAVTHGRHRAAARTDSRPVATTACGRRASGGPCFLPCDGSTTRLPYPWRRLSDAMCVTCSGPLSSNEHGVHFSAGHVPGISSTTPWCATLRCHWCGMQGPGIHAPPAPWLQRRASLGPSLPQRRLNHLKNGKGTPLVQPQRHASRGLSGQAVWTLRLALSVSMTHSFTQPARRNRCAAPTTCRMKRNIPLGNPPVREAAGAAASCLTWFSRPTDHDSHSRIRVCKALLRPICRLDFADMRVPAIEAAHYLDQILQIEASAV